MSLFSLLLKRALEGAIAVVAFLVATSLGASVLLAVFLAGAVASFFGEFGRFGA